MYHVRMSMTATWTGSAIRAALADTGVSQKALSDTTGIPYPTLRRKLGGHKDFTLAELLVIAEAMHVHPSVLVPPQFKTSTEASRDLSGVA